MQTQQPIHRLARRIRPLVGCVALFGLVAMSITAVLPGGAASSASAYADDSIPAQTTKVVERHVIVKDGDFETLRNAIEQASPGVTTVVELSGDYEAPTSFDTSAIAIPGKADVRINVPDGSEASLRREEGSTSTKTLFSLGNDTSSALTISGDFTYHDSFTMAYVGTGCTLTVNGGTFADNSTTGNGGLIYADNGTLTINGGTFSNNSTSSENSKGGAIYANNTALTINGGTFTGNSTSSKGSGGAIYANNGTTTVNGGTFTGNSATGNGNHTGNGGAIYANNGSLTVTGNVTFSNNTATCKTGTYSVGGGAIYAFDATMSIGGGAKFTNNTAVSGGRLGGGGAIWAKGSLTINDATFSNNVHDPVGGWHFGGGAIFMSGLTADGSSKNQTKSTLTISKATFTGNEAKNNFDKGGGQYGDGGAIFLGWNSTMILQGQQDGISFTNNKAARLGGAVYTEEDTVTYMAQSLMTNNTTGHFGGGLWLCPSGQGISSKGNSVIAVNNTAKLEDDRYANGEIATVASRNVPTSGAAGDDFAIMSPTKPGISNSYELSNTGWGNDENTQVVHWYQDGTITKYTDGLGTDSLLSGTDTKGLSVASNSTRYVSGASEYKPGTISSKNTSGVKDANGVVQCSGNTADCVQSIGVTLKATMDTVKAQDYKSKASVVFTGNHSDNAGGAFGSDGAVVFASPYNAAWRKVNAQDLQSKGTKSSDSSDPKALAGSEWTLTIKQSQISTKSAQGQNTYMTADGRPTPYFSEAINDANCNRDKTSCWVSDNNASDPTWTLTIKDNSGYDENSADGEFNFSNLAGGTFTLKETKAPTGYYLSKKTYTFTTGDATKGFPDIQMDGKDLPKSSTGVPQIGDDMIPTSIAWNKVDSQSKSKIDGSVWQLLKKNGNDYTAVDGYTSISDCTSGDCTTSADKDATAGGFRLNDLAAGEYRLKETTVPTGYADTDDVKDRTYDFVIPDSTQTTPDTSNVIYANGVYMVLLKNGTTSKFDKDSETNVIGNDRKTGSVAWNKVKTDDKSEKLSGSAWQLQVKNGDNWVALQYDANADGSVKWQQPSGAAPPTSITDCTAKECTGADADAEGGAFKLSGLGWGTYRLIETKAPSGFVLPDKKTTWYEFTIDAEHTGDTDIALLASSEKGSNAEELLTSSSDGQGQKPNTIANVAVVVQLPFTGGLTDRAWLLGGLALCVTALLGNALRKRMNGNIN